MREIKFRGFSKDYNAWVYGDLLHLETDFVKYHSIIDWSKDKARIRIENGSLGQYTGLKDSEDVPFYVGDIFDIGQTVNGQSKFVLMDCVGGFDIRYAHEINRKYEYDVNDLFKPSKYEGVVEFKIIGNIYSNPELLKENL